MRHHTHSSAVCKNQKQPKSPPTDKGMDKQNVNVIHNKKEQSSDEGDNEDGNTVLGEGSRSQKGTCCVILFR